MKKLRTSRALSSTCVLSLYTLLLINFLNITIVLGRPVNENFKFKLYTTNVLRWKNGDGGPMDTQQSIAKTLQNELLSAKKSIDFAVFGVKSQSWLIEDISSLRKNVQIRAVVDQEKGELGDWTNDNFIYEDTPLFAETIGLENVVVDESRKSGRARASIMHNKYMIMDKEKVWLGSANLSSSCIGDEYNANTILAVSSKALAELYTQEFSQMYDNRLFSTAKEQQKSLDQKLEYKDGTKVSVYFSPQDDPINQGIVPLLNSAKQTIDVMMFVLTDQRAANALKKAQKRGVKVRIIHDAVSASMGISLHKDMRNSGIEVRVENWGGKMHAKSAVIDSKKVVIGSMNWSEAGTNSNDENTLIIENQKLADGLTDYFEKLWNALNFYQLMDPDHIEDPRAESLFSINSCFDGIDNNYNGLVDSEEIWCH